MTFPDSKGHVWTIANQESSSHGTTQDKMKGPSLIPKGMFEQLLTKRVAAMKPPKTRWKECKPCSHPDFVRDPTFEPLL